MCVLMCVMCEFVIGGRPPAARDSARANVHGIEAADVMVCGHASGTCPCSPVQRILNLDKKL